MPEVPTPVEVGFAEFIARLISEVFSSIVTAQADQEERNSELLAAAALTAEQYSALHLSDLELSTELQRLFPPRDEDGEQSHAIYDDSPYIPAKGEQAESPALASIGIILSKEELRRQRSGPAVLRDTAVKRIIEQVASLLSQIRLNILKEMAARGLPRVMVDSGRINGKMTFHLLENSADSTPTTPSASPTADTINLASTARLASLNTTALRSLSLPQARILPNVKLLVRQADERAPTSSQVTANVFGEVEITFKTVT